MILSLNNNSEMQYIFQLNTGMYTYKILNQTKYTLCVLYLRVSLDMAITVLQYKDDWLTIHLINILTLNSYIISIVILYFDRNCLTKTTNDVNY